MFGWLGSKRSKCNHPWRMERPLFQWDASGRDVFTIADSFCGLLCLGRTGAGKSTATGFQLAISMLLAGYGGLVLTVKTGEKEQWIEYCRRAGRLSDLRVFDASGIHRFNFLDELLAYQGADSGLTENVAALFTEIGRIGSRHSSQSSGQGDNEFFQLACKQLIRNLIDLLILATGRISVADLCRLVAALPRSVDQVASESWRQSNYCFKLLEIADKRPKSPRQQRDYEALLDYVCSEFVNLAERTRSSIIATFTGMADLFQRGLLHELFSTTTNLSPRDILEGKIILIDLPIKAYGEVGLYAQLVWKLLTQRCLERRVLTPETRPAFIFVDEAQFFASQQSDALFATTCRSARVANVLLSQSISGFETAFGGGEMGRALSEQLFANLSTKVIHATGDYGTATWAADLVGRNYRLLTNGSSSYAGPDWAGMMGIGGGAQSSAGMAESLQYDIEPREFGYLRTGGPANNWLVDGIVIRSGNPFHATGKIYMPVTFNQKR